MFILHSVGIARTIPVDINPIVTNSTPSDAVFPFLTSDTSPTICGMTEEMGIF